MTDHLEEVSLNSIDEEEFKRSLLRRYEPVICFTRGEHFFPAAVEPYVGESSFWVQPPTGPERCLVPQGELTLARLGAHRAADYLAEPGSVFYLKYAVPLDVFDLVRYKQRARQVDRQENNVFRGGTGRLARVGYLSRFVDSLFSLLLLARGRVSGDLAAASRIAYERAMKRDERYQYYGRVLPQEGWTVLQYWFFYHLNDWRSGFRGANDHEGDWEMITLYLAEGDSAEGGSNLVPQWVAYAAHNFHGDDLRRRWDDPEVQKVGEHPVVYAGAGSHASYFSAGEYVTEVPLPYLSRLSRLVETIREASWYRRLYGDQTEGKQESSNILKVPFIDYARGDGLTLGPGQEKRWAEPGLIDPSLGWVSSYRGLWGLYARDPLSGEDAPAGPMYNRDGTVRQSWYDPLGWAGLDKETPPRQAIPVVHEQRETLLLEQEQLRSEESRKGRQLRGLAAESMAIRDQPDMRTAYKGYQDGLESLGQELTDIRARIAHNELVLRSLTQHEARLKEGFRTPMRAHIRRAHEPTSQSELVVNRWLEVWSAASIGFMLIVLALTYTFRRDLFFTGLVIIIYLTALIEAVFRRQVARFLNRIAVFLATVASLILFARYFSDVMVVTVLLVGIYILWENLRELRL